MAASLQFARFHFSSAVVHFSRAIIRGMQNGGSRRANEYTIAAHMIQTINLIARSNNIIHVVNVISHYHMH